jgi:cytochrome c peroxidase
MKSIKAISGLALAFGIFLAGCTKEIPVYKQDIEPILPEQTLSYVNPGWTEVENAVIGDLDQILSAQGITDHGATLGRVLFYDPQLSINNRISCASCHAQEKAFSDPVKFSQGFENIKTSRNSMAVVNPILNNNLFWDSRVQSVEDLVVQPIQHKVEMGMESMEDLTNKLGGIDYYPALFKKAYGTAQISQDLIVDAISQFMRSMVSLNSKYDQGLLVDFNNFNEMEKRGKVIFFSEKAQCSSCHQGANFSAPDGFANGLFLDGTENIFIDEMGFDNPYIESQGTANIGLDLIYSDNGRGDGQFKIPSLRNIELTGPYMHDGRYETLEEVVEHYNSKIQLHENLDKKFIKNGSSQQLNLSNSDKAALVAFLKTLTDREYVKAERYSNPFKQ